MKPVLYFAAVVAALCLFGPTPADAGHQAAAPGCSQPAQLPAYAPAAAPSCHVPAAAPVYYAPQPVTYAAPACSTCVTAQAAPLAAVEPHRTIYRKDRLATWRANRAARGPRRLAMLTVAAAPVSYAPAAYAPTYYAPPAASCACTPLAAPVMAPAPALAPEPAQLPAELGEGY